MIPCTCGDGPLAVFLHRKGEKYGHPYSPDLSYVRGIVEHAATLATEGKPEAIEAIRAELARFDADALSLNPNGEDA